MRKILFCSFLIVIIIGFISIPNLIKGRVPYPGNLLVSFYNPWVKTKMPGWEQGVPNKPIGQDEIRIFYPNRTLTTWMIKKSHIFPLWNPYAFSGTYLAGQSETAVYYPLSILFLFLPQLLTWTIMVLIQPVIAGIGMYLYLRLLFKENMAAVFGSIAFAFSGVVIVRMVEGLSMGHSLIWFPLALYGTEAYIQKKRMRYLLVTLMAMTFSLLAGWFQYTFYIVVVTWLYAFYRLNQCRMRSFVSRGLLFFPFMVLPIITLFHVIPVMQAFFESSRGVSDASSTIGSLLLPFKNLITLLVPDFLGNPGTYTYIGTTGFTNSMGWIAITPFIFSLFTMIYVKKHSLIRFSWGMMIGSLVLAFNNPISNYLIELKIPIISTFIPSRLFLISTFFLCVLSGFGVDILFREQKSGFRNLIKICYFICTILTSSFLFYLGMIFVEQGNFTILFFDKIPPLTILLGRLYIQWKSTFIPSLIVFGFLGIALFMNRLLVWAITVLFRTQISNPEVKIVIGIAFVLMLGQQYVFMKKYLPFSEQIFVFPAHPVFTYLSSFADINRSISVTESYIESNILSQYRLFSPEGVASMYPQRYGELISYIQSSGSSRTSIDRIEAKVNLQRQELIEGKNPYTRRFMAIDGVKYILDYDLNASLSAVPIAARIIPVFHANGWTVYENKDSLPRIYLTQDYKIQTDSDAILSEIFSGPVDSKNIVIEKYPGFEPAKSAEGSISLLSYLPNRIEIETKSDLKSLLYLSDTYSDSFRVTIDGVPSTLLRANYAFRAVSVPAGVHRIVMYFDTGLIWVGFYTAGFMLIITVSGIILLVKYKKLLF